MYDPGEALLQLGLYDYVWGDPGLLQTYNSNIQAEKARAEQAEYNKLWKQIEDEKNAAAAAQARQQEVKEAKVEMAKLNKELINAKPQEAVVIRRQQDALVSKYPELKEFSDEARMAKAEEDAYQKAKVGFIGSIPSVFANDMEKQKQIDAIIASNLREEDKKAEIDRIRGIKSTAQLGREASQSAVAGHAGKKTGEALTVSDILAKSANPGYYPTSADKATMKAAGYVWDKVKRQYIGN